MVPSNPSEIEESNARRFQTSPIFRMGFLPTWAIEKGTL